MESNCIADGLINPPVLQQRFPDLAAMAGYDIGYLHFCTFKLIYITIH